MRGVRLSGVSRPGVALAGFIFFTLPALAQSSGLQPAFLRGTPAQPFFVPGASGVSLLPNQPATLRPFAAETKLQGMPALPTPLSVSPSIAADQNMVVRMTASFEQVRTPFLKQVRVPLVSIWSGRVQLSGFQSVAPMENLLCGLPLKNSASGGGLIQQCHAGIRFPSNNQSYGLSLRFRFSKQDADRAGNGLWNATRQAVSWGHTFLTF